ncbi:PH-BEACH domain [Dillenia turbinata]|uniref:PH-BEACH domain n=1 Tax=Dillenia turbinata TaxID=194707 RepID=A0AAN8ZL32_9MAGN
MNIVKGVADLIRRTSGGQTGDSLPALRAEKFSAPVPRIRFSEVGDEAILNTLWERYMSAVEKVEKRNLFNLFLKQFLVLYKTWMPLYSGQLPEVAFSAVPPVDESFDVTVVGCSAGHPAEVIMTFVEEVVQLTALVTELNASISHTTTDISWPSTSLNIISEGFLVLDALTIVIRSTHNCRNFGYYGGIQKLTALMKVFANESMSDYNVEKIGLFQRILVYVVCIICSFVDPSSDAYEKAQLYSNITVVATSKDCASLSDLSSFHKGPLSGTWLHWHQKAIVLVMEAGGLNWLVELLRVGRRLSMKKQLTDISLLYMTLRTLHLALSENPRGQNHFRSIGGLEVLLDGLGLPSNDQLIQEREQELLLRIFHLHVLSLEEYEKHSIDLIEQKKSSVPSVDSRYENCSSTSIAEPLVQLRAKGSFFPQWIDYTNKLSRVVCSFLLAPEDITLTHNEASASQISVAASSAYWELSAKWAMKVLLVVFPCIKACSNRNELPSHLRIFIDNLQRNVLYTFRKVLVSSPMLLDTFREEGIWDFIFSENFFYFRPALEDFGGGYCTFGKGFSMKFDINRSYSCTESPVKSGECEILQLEVISFVEFAATFNTSAHNLPECSVLLDALEQSACNPGIASVLGRSLLRILQLSNEKTIASFKSLDAIARVLKVACVQAQESKRPSNISPRIEANLEEPVLSQSSQDSYLSNVAQICIKSIETSLELLSEFCSVADDGKNLVLRHSMCIDCLFDLFWEEDLRDLVLKNILDLMRVPPSPQEDQKAKLQLCSKYLETFTLLKEREKCYSELAIDLLVGMRQMLAIDQMVLFRKGECFLHVVSLLNGNLDDVNGEKLVLNVLETLTCLLNSNDASKAAFRALVGSGYQTLQSLLLDFCGWRPSEELLNALLDMLVDGKFDLKANPVIKNDDVILLYLTVLQKSSDPLRSYGLNVFQQLLKDSISNRASCVRAGMLNFLLDWFSQENEDSTILKLALLIQVTGGHSISGKDIRKIFALLRSEKVGIAKKYYSLLLSSISSMLNEKGPTTFFDLNGNDSGIVIKTPVQWPINKGFSFSCWIRVENFPRNGTMGLFCFLTDNGRGTLALLAKDKLIYESINQKRQCVSLHATIVRKKWHFLCITHSIGRAFSGGSLLRCYVDGDLISSEKCRYVKITEPLTCCKIGTKICLPFPEEDNTLYSIRDTSPFFGQIGPMYIFNDAITSEQVQIIYTLGPSYMYSFLDNEVPPPSDGPLSIALLDTKDGLGSKILIGLNAQASHGRDLFNVSPLLDHPMDKNNFEATVMVGTQLCSRRLLQQIIYCVGGVSVFFPLLTQSESYENEEIGESGYPFPALVTKEHLTATVIELIASVLDENVANQQQMHLLSGFSVLGFLLQSVPPKQLNLEMLSALKHLFNVVANSSSQSNMSELLVKDAISGLFLNPSIWIYTVYKVQRELYMFLIQQLDNDPRLLKSLCRLPHVIDIIRQFYWDAIKGRSAFGSKPLLHPITKQVIGERPSTEEIHKIRVLLLSLGEMSLRQNIIATDIKALIAFFETSQDMVCIEDVLHMVLRAVSQRPLLASFLEQVNLLGGCQIFINLLQRDYEPIRLLSLQFLGRLLVSLPPERKGPRFFNIGVGRSKSDNQRKASLKTQALFTAISERLFRFPRTDNLCATLFDVLLGGASPKQVLQKHAHLDKQRSRRSNTHFFLPQTLVLIFRFLSGCEDASARIKIIRDLLDLVDSNPSNIEALMENAWNSWLAALTRLDVLKHYKVKSQVQGNNEMNEQNFVRNLFCVVLCHCMHSVKGGWQQFEYTINFLLVQFEQGAIPLRNLLRDIFEDLIQRLVNISSDENIFLSQLCRDNTLYLLKLADEMLLLDNDYTLPYPASCSEFCIESFEIENYKDLSAALSEAIHGEYNTEISRNSNVSKQPINQDDKFDVERWNLHDNLWVIINKLNGKGPSKSLPKSSVASGPSFGQRARGLVESLNIPAAEMAAVVVSGGIGNALGGKPTKNVDKAMLLRGEKCPRIVFRLVVLYLCRSSLERASQCVQQVISLLPCLLTADDEQSKSRLQLLIWSLLAVRSQCGMLDDGARFHVISRLIRETVNSGKLLLASSIAGIDDSSDSGSGLKETGSIQNLVQKDRVLAAVADEVKYIRSLKSDRIKQLQELQNRMDENSAAESNHKKIIEDEIQNSLNTILASDDSRTVAFQLAHDEEQQIVAEKWIHMFRALIDERGPWSANPFPNSTTIHWKLDKTEDAWRRRPKLRQNYHFDEKLCHRPSNATSTESISAVSESKSGFAGNIPAQIKLFLLKGVRWITDEGCSEPTETNTELSLENSSESQDPEHLKGSVHQSDTVQDKKDPPSTSIDTESNEVMMSIPCVLVSPKRKLAGCLAVMKNALHFFGEFLVEGTGGSSVFKSFNASGISDLKKLDQLGGLQKQKHFRWPSNNDSAAGKGNVVDYTEGLHENTVHKLTKKVKRHRRWNICKIKSVYWTRYLLRYTAIEIFFSDSVAPIFLNFASQKDAKDVGTLIVSNRNELLLPKGSNRDKNGAISFVFEDRYRNFSDPDIPSFYYGSHYSSMGIVLFYLLRLEPFTALHRNLQGGKFDHADRLFQSIEGTFRNCLSNTSDVKELIPEFFYMPEFLVNSNSYHLGVKQDGELISDVCLPPWAKGSPEEFISRNREALESEYVSSNLHHWIDLVFGYKQRGTTAVEAANVFYYLTYEGAVDLDTMDDELQRSAIEDQIANFGQTPIQIFCKKHPRRGPPIPIAHPLYFAPDSINLTSIVPSASQPVAAVLFVGTLDSNVILVNQGLTMSVKMWLTTQLQSGGNFTFSGSQEPFFGIGSDILSPRKIGSPLAENIELGAQCFATMHTLHENFLITCGNWENSFQIISLTDGRMVQSIRQHKDVVSCVAVTSDGSILATGSYDTTVMVWEVRVRAPERKARNAQNELPRKDYVIVETPFHILCGHDDVITCLYVSVELDIVISGSRDGTCIFHSLREGRYVRSLLHPSGSALSKLVASRHGRVVLYSNDDLSLHLYSINGKHIATSESNGRLNCIELSSCGEFLVCAGDQGQVTVRSMNSLEVVKRYNGVGKVITSLAVTQEECFLAGTKEGILLVYSIENPQLRKASIPRK